ncbi:protein shortage in chiasmata 1 ortholog isoform X12 [Parus major]|uniref:protein shortage in chiasmata 1 ortholog isoform X12 n=1 Tax=Parus major TaxID=9157 RepID=UPI00077163D1|nr:protein shortage in chiasmata 1 ortholog isoform X12 [Parus major]
MLKTSQNKMFAALKYHSTDYLYESMARQKFSIWKLSLCFPPCLHQDEKYHLNGLFADDKYRKPWTRIGSTQNMIAISVLDQKWKKSLLVEDFLEKKPIFSVGFQASNDLIEVIPSSNPCSQTGTEECFLLTKNGFKGDSTQDKYLKIYYATEFKEPQQDLCLEEEFVFIDNLENFRRKLPTLSILLSRLQFFLVKDPLLDSEGQILRAENIFRECLTFQNEIKMEESQNELQGIKENFCTVSIKDEEYFLLPAELEFGKPSNGRSDCVKIPSYLQLKEMLNLTPVTVDDEDICKQVIREDLKAAITYKIEISKYCAIPREVCSSISTSMLEFCESVEYIPYLNDEMEMPLTPPCRQQRSWVNFLCRGLQEEPISLSSNSILIAEPSREFLESLVWQSEKYRDNMSSLLLVEHPDVNLAHQHHSLTELQKKLPVEIEAPMLGSLEEGWWLHMGLSLAAVEILEQFNMDGSNANSLLPTEIETFTKFTSYQLEKSQLQAFFLLEEAAIPVLKDLTHLGVLASVTWSFDSVKFDHTRFFLKQQEKVICDNFQQGKIDEKEIMLFRHAALVHLLVTVRDLLLTCGLDTALGYLSKAKDIYKNILESCLNNIWRQLKIIQYSSQKKHETHPKITALQCEILNWMKSYGEKQSVKILIITRMDSEKAAFIHPLSGIDAGLKVVDLNSEKKGSTLSCKEIISNLSRYSCVIVHNQQIGADFPWTHFSLVMEYDYSENSGWKNLCKNLNITYMTFKTTLPGTIQMRNHGGSFLLEVQIPYVFLTTEGLLNMPDILQLFESKYSITFVERSSSYSLRLFGSIDRYVVLTIDEGTAIFLQSMEELNYEDSCDTVILRLMALSLQYMCCWIIFYSRERLSSEYSLKGNTLLNLVLIYATLIELTQKSEDFEVKVILTPGIEETALVIRQIADNILIASDISPHEWLDKSWLSVLPSETEKCLLTFPCINPLVAQFMLKKGSSLNRLFLASFDQLQELLPEVPKKVLKHFSDMVSSYSLNTAAPLEKTVKSASRPENQNNFNTLYLDNKQNCQILDLLDKAQNNTGTSHMNFEPLIPPLNHHKGVLNSDLPSCMRKKACLSDVITRRKPDFIAVSKDYEDFAHLEVKNSLHVQRQPFRMHDSSDNSSKDCEKEDFFATFSDCVPQESFKSFLEEFTDTTCNSPEIQIAQPLWNDSLSTSPHNSFAHDDFLSDFFNGMDKLPNLNFNQVGGASKGKRKQRPPFFWTKENIKTDSGFPEVQEFKKRKLTYERVPGRRDGQTRLKFF